MRGIIVDKEGKPLQFRVQDPQSGTVQLAIMQVKGGMVSMHNVPAGQVLPHDSQVQPRGYTPAGRGGGARVDGQDFRPVAPGAPQPQEEPQGEVPAAATT